ncbi:methyltransferase domain-containing protein [Rhizobium sp. XQZ8]|uniref:protein-L-isoaspartate O-methyltransferase family protein n=1 Tax=Rhizobium populisoli TaxID=2859785 RepID=UPI001CA590E7|nr:methyltransferase domain-containing protein [Rhizobium populisoli]MBW6420579.1 methyltransferase domain-containing protein [Rhizobium populisoli]
MAFGDEPIHRQIYARQILAKAGVAKDDRLLAAFAKVAREDFIGPPPWVLSDFQNYRQLASEDPIVLYQDILVGLDTARGVNNGMPSLHVGAIHALGVREGEVVAHLGAGSGYYSAILAELVGPSGKVVAVEYDEALAQQARENLGAYSNVEVVTGDATDWPKEDADVIYANFALDHPPEAWIENLAVSGRLLFPLGFPGTEGGRRNSFTRAAAFLMIDRRAGNRFGARFLQPVSFVWAEGQKPAPVGRHEGLEQAFRSRRGYQVRSFRWQEPPTAGEWYGEEDWGLSFDEV